MWQKLGGLVAFTLALVAFIALAYLLQNTLMLPLIEANFGVILGSVLWLIGGFVTFYGLRKGFKGQLTVKQVVFLHCPALILIAISGLLLTSAFQIGTSSVIASALVMAGIAVNLLIMLKALSEFTRNPRKQ